MRTIFTLFVMYGSLVVTSFAAAQGWGFAQPLNRPNDSLGTKPFPYRIETDAAENVYVLTNDFPDWFRLTKYDSLGNFIWGKKIDWGEVPNTISYAIGGANSIAVDPSGDVYLCGNFLGFCSIDSVVLISNFINNANQAWLNGWLAKLDGATGALRWMHMVDGELMGNAGPQTQRLYDLCFANGKLWVTGSVDTAGTALRRIERAFIAKIDPNTGLFLDKAVFESAIAEGLQLEQSGGKDFIWLLRNRLAGTLGGIPITGINDSTLNSMAIAKVDTSFNVFWAHSPSDGRIYPGSMELGAAGEIYVSGAFWPPLTFDSIPVAGYGLADGYVAAFDALGTSNWIQVLGGPANDEAPDLEMTANGKLSFMYSGPSPMNLGANVSNLVHSGTIMGEVNPVGNFLSIVELSNDSNSEFAQMSITASDAVFFTGTMQDTSSLGPFAAVITPANQYTAYLARYGLGPVTAVVDAQKPWAVRVYPNPFGSVVHVASEQVIGRFTLHNSMGQVVSQHRLDALDFDIPAETLAQGLYFLELEGENGQRMRLSLIRN